MVNLSTVFCIFLPLLLAHRPIPVNQMAVVRMVDWFVAAGMYQRAGRVPEFPRITGTRPLDRHLSCPSPVLGGTRTGLSRSRIIKIDASPQKSTFFPGDDYTTAAIQCEAFPARWHSRRSLSFAPPILARIPSRSLRRPQSRSSLPRAFKSITFARLFVIPPQGFVLPSCVRVI